MSLNFGQFPTPRLPIANADIVVGYQLVGGVPTLAQYTMLQVFAGAFPGGVIPVTQGGTGLAAVATGSVLVGGTAGVLNTAPPGAAGTVLVSQGAGQVPLFSNLIVTNATPHGQYDPGRHRRIREPADYQLDRNGSFSGCRRHLQPGVERHRCADRHFCERGRG